MSPSSALYAEPEGALQTAPTIPRTPEVFSTPPGARHVVGITPLRAYSSTNLSEKMYVPTEQGVNLDVLEIVRSISGDDDDDEDIMDPLDQGDDDEKYIE